VVGLLCMALLRGFAGPLPRATLAFEVAGAPGRVGAWIAAPMDGSLALQFSDGSMFTLARGARARVVSTSADGAHLVLERGRADVHVQHRPHTDFRIKAGPFEVLVVGTRFALGWESPREQFVLTMEEGVVQVTGPGLPAPKLLRAGQQLKLLAGPEGVAPTPRDVATAPVPQAGGLPSIHPAASPEPAAPAIGPRRGVHTPLRERPLAPRAEVEQAAATSLVQRADVARFAGRPDEALAALLELRVRFPRHLEARESAFWLGRLYADQLALPGDAVRWLELYLHERPAGPFVRETYGRLIEAHVRCKDTLRARGAAEDYLARYPLGPHARIARQVLGAGVAP
jgi:hypothetical protein